MRDKKIDEANKIKEDVSIIKNSIPDLERKKKFLRMK